MFKIIERSIPVSKCLRYLQTSFLFVKVRFATTERNLIDLSVQDVSTWLQSAGVDPHDINALKSKNIDGNMLAKMTEGWLKSNLDISAFTALRIDALIDKKLKLDEQTRKKQEKTLNKKTIQIDYDGSGVFSAFNLYSQEGLRDYLRQSGASSLLKVTANQVIADYDDLEPYAQYKIIAKTPTEIEAVTSGVKRLERFQHNMSSGFEKLVRSFQKINLIFFQLLI